MGYVPYTATKDYFEEPNTGGDLVLYIDSSSGEVEITCIEETALPTLGLVPPSSRIGVTYGKFLDVVKIYVSASAYTGDTISLFSDKNSPLYNTLTSSIFPRLKIIVAATGLGGINTDQIAGKVLRVDYLPESTGKFAGAIITLLLYM